MAVIKKGSQFLVRLIETMKSKHFYSRNLSSLEFQEEISLIDSLKVCAKHKDLCKGMLIHSDILKRGLLKKKAFLGSTLMNMYVKCGAVMKAQEVFDELPSPDIVCWNVLITGYAQLGHYMEALNCFERLQHEGLSPNVVTFASILKACSNIGAAETGKEIHARIVRDGFVTKDVFLGSVLIEMYVKCGDIARARRVFDELQVQNIVCWNVLIAGYAQCGYNKEVLNCYERMQQEGLAATAVTFGVIVKACGNIGAVDKGIEIHAAIIREGLLMDDVLLGTALVDMYAKCGIVSKAQEVFDVIQGRDVICWNALISGYAHGHGEVALKRFEQMQQEGYIPSITTYICVVDACGSIGAADKGKEVHSNIISRGSLDKGGSLATALIDMYAKCQDLQMAQQVLDRLPVRDVVCWTALLAGYAQHGQGKDALICYERMQLEGFSPDAVTYVCVLKACGSMGAIELGKQVHANILKARMLENNILLGTTLVDMYSKCGAVDQATQVFDQLSARNVVCWNALITAYAQHGPGEKALECLEQMQNDGYAPDSVTYACVLKACGSIGALEKGKELHAEIVRDGLFGKHIMVDTALVDMYARCGDLGQAKVVFDQISVRNLVCWNALITAYAQHGRGEEAISCYDSLRREGFSPDAITFACVLKACGNIQDAGKGKEIHDQMIKEGLLVNETWLGTALIDMYVKCGDIAKAQEVFNSITDPDLVCWSTLITGCVLHGHGEEALQCFVQMRREGLLPDVVTYGCIIKACGSIGAADKGKEIHDEVVREGLLESSMLIANALIEMYVKSGELKRAHQVFSELDGQSVICWNALMAGYAQLGQCSIVFESLDNMIKEGIDPDSITFTIVLGACSHSGIADEGQMCFKTISEAYSIIPDVEHHTCMVDLFGRAGQFGKALAVIEMMPSSDYLPVWSALMGACRKWDNLNLAKLSFQHTVHVDKRHSSVYISMGNICVATSIQGHADEIDTFMVHRTAWNEQRCFWTDLYNNACISASVDKDCSQCEDVFY